jgi:alkylation response protein AidB-like acyl-CoA dehydrogenase
MIRLASALRVRVPLLQQLSTRHLSVGIGLTEDQLQYQKLAWEFAQDNMIPFASKWDEDKSCPIDTMREAASLGFAGVYTSPEYGGTGLSRKDAAVIFEQLARGKLC